MIEDGVHELEVPQDAHQAKLAVEVLRAWVADGALLVTFQPDTFRGSISEWGRLLSDIAHHIAMAVELEGEMAAHEALSAMRGAFDKGLLTAATTASGSVKGRVKH